MALTKAARKKLNSLVQQSKNLLIVEVEDQLQQYYGIRPDGTITDVETLTTNDPTLIHKAGLLRQRLTYLLHSIPDSKTKQEEGFNQLVREQAFTVLNRMASLRMAEERTIIQESIRNGYNSEGFLVFDDLTGRASTANQFQRYTWYIFALFDELATDLPAVFERYSPYSILFPRENTLLKLLAILNEEEIILFREEGHQPVNLWKEDETIGWIYQYYNSKEEKSNLRKASEYPRNSRELAVRNQFFTPRYIVQFLTDNSLGRIWYEMTKGQTVLKDFCQYLVQHPNEVFLEQGEQKPSAEIDEKEQIETPTYIEHHSLKDPREITMIDPACGSMHFGLYSFDLFEKIYLECWDNHRTLIRPIIDEYQCVTKEQYAQLIPSLIIRHNIHGVDIDPRAVQISGLSLWLRAQKSYQRLDLAPRKRPAITKANIICAEPMPGDKNLLHDFLQTVDAPIRPLVKKIWEQMQLVGETGVLLKIEEELRTAIEQTKEEWEAYKLKVERNVGTQIDLFSKKEELLVKEQEIRYQNINEDFFDKAETMVLNALKQYSEKATNGTAYQKHLFAEDTARGFAFIDLCRKRYDVVLMNPPFGPASIKTEKYYKKEYPYWAKNILCCFFGRLIGLLKTTGKLGAIFDRTAIIKSSYENFRIDNLIGRIDSMLDTGWDVLDANVETTALVLNFFKGENEGFFIDLRNKNKYEKQHSLFSILKKRDFIKQKSIKFHQLPNSIIGYDLKQFLINAFNEHKSIENTNLTSRQGHALVSDQHFRLYWEPLSQSGKYNHLYNGGTFSMFYSPTTNLAKTGDNYKYVKNNSSVVLRNNGYHFKPGVGFGKRGNILDSHLLKAGFNFSVEGLAATDLKEEDDALILLSFLNSIYAQLIVNTYCGQHKYTGYVNKLPIPKVNNFDTSIVIALIKIKEFWVSRDETVIEYKGLLKDFFGFENIKEALLKLKVKLSDSRINYKEFVDKNDEFWLDKSNIPLEEQSLFVEYKKNRPKEYLWFNSISLKNWENHPSHSYEIIQALFGVIFGRWDINSIIDISKVQDFSELFDPLPFQPVVCLEEVTDSYPIDLPTNGILVNDTKNQKHILKQIRNVIRLLWKNNPDKIESELCKIGEFENLDGFINSTNGFFNYHLERYTKSRRLAPIYWPLSTASGNFTIWIYYPKITDQTLFKIINDFINPKLEQLQKEIATLESETSTKLLNDLKGQVQEIKNLKDEVLKIVELPFKPNHDDGVLITAAPLHKLFSHTKWRKATEVCWKKLEAGEYDWAHLAYSIWPERVREKCKKDLSLAIAHGLEAICEIKPKVKRVKKEKKGTPKNKQLTIDE